VWQYEVRGERGTADDLAVEAQFAPGSADDLRADDDAAAFVRDVRFWSASRGDWTAAPAHGSTWSVACREGCRVRYRFALREAATRLDDPGTAIASGDVLVAPSSTWLLRPDPPVAGQRFRFHVALQPPARFASGTRLASPVEGTDTYEADTDSFDATSFSAFGPFYLETLRGGTSRVDVAVAPHGLSLSNADVVDWVTSAVAAISSYYGRFLVERTLVVVMAGRPDAPTRGETLGDGGPAVLVRVGSKVTAATTRDDWVVTHELLHVTLPSLPRDHVWLSEGIPTYVEPIARARVGLVTPEKFWQDLVEGLPQGLPEKDDEGLDRTHTWGRTYWGGALFCLMADVTIRERTGNSRSLDDALRGVVFTGADVEEHWSVDRLLDVGDRSTGTRVLHDLYRDMALAPGTVDLPALWARLGVRVEHGHVQFDDRAPLAAVRRAITARSPDE
jgi:hypothetical protein